MFIKQSIFEKILNKSFKGVGFKIGMIDEADDNGEIGEKYVIQSEIGTWRIITDVHYMPKEAKASIIKIIGEMPSKGECWSINKDSSQLEMLETIYPRMLHKKKLSKTDIYVKDSRVYQDEENKKIYLLRNIFDVAVTFSAINESYESVPVGPYIDTTDNYICWENETTCFEVARGFIEPGSTMEDIIHRMEEISFIQM